MTEADTTAEKLSNLNRESISQTTNIICKKMESISDGLEMEESIALFTESGQSVEMQLQVMIRLYGIQPLVTISLSQDESPVASRTMALGLDDESENPSVIITGRVDTYQHQGVGIGSGLLQSSEHVAKKVIELSDLPKNAEVTIILHDATNSRIHEKQGWSGEWARRLGYTKIGGRENYFSKILGKTD